MDILNFHKSLIRNYKTYIQSFLTIKDARILHFVDSEIEQKKLWPEPLVQFNPTFEKGRPLAALVADGLLHPELNCIFNGYTLYKHQEEAILLGARNQEFIVTSGTGSGKSLTYLATIFNQVLQLGAAAGNNIQAVVVYPMNALINSQYKEIEKFKKTYEDTFQRPFPITFNQYTGQESDEQKEKLKSNPPHILLTNYMMLELLMTRAGRDVEVRHNFLAHAKFLVFDELHTYRGRKGADVSLLIRRIKASASNPISCIGTSATMVSDAASSLLEQKKIVADIGSMIFGTDFQPSQVVNEYLVQSIGAGQSPTHDALRQAVRQGVSVDAPAHAFEIHPTPNWIEEQIVLERKEGVFVRRKPITLSTMAAQLAELTNLPSDEVLRHLEHILEWANILNTNLQKEKNFLPYRIHQFIAQTGSVYATLGDQQSRTLLLDAGLYADSKDTKLFPLVFSRSSGHEMYSVSLSAKTQSLMPRENYDVADDEAEASDVEGYVFIQHLEDQEPIWDPDRDIPELPESWFNPPKRDGTRSIKSEKAARLPQKIWFTKSGDYSFTEPLTFEGWFIRSPLLLDPTAGTLFDTQTAEWTKVMKLGGEGRSTATTVLSFETIAQLKEFGVEAAQQKLLSFTDNRQDASLQAGHFNDFIKVGQLRAAISKALTNKEALDYSVIPDRVFECLHIGQEQFANQPAIFPGPKKENEDVFKDFIMYRLLHDLRRSWRMILPNLEQCALLRIDYRYLADTVQHDSLWADNSLLSAMSPEMRQEFVYQILDFFRKSYALRFSMLASGAVSANSRKIREVLKAPWTLDENETLELPSHIRIESLANTAGKLYTESAGFQSIFGRYIRKVAAGYGMEIKGKAAYNDFTYALFNFLTEAGWLSSQRVKNADGDPVHIYQLNVENILWMKGDGQTLTPDLIKTRSYKPIQQKPNAYFQRFYQTNFDRMAQMEGREHTGQINTDKRKDREEEFRAGKIGALFCSPTMELGIDISDLSIVHMRNVPPSPANYAQRSGRAGRSGQAALVLVYCSNFSAHDRHYFKHASQMVSGSVTAPRMDLLNEELLRSHLHAAILTTRPLSLLNASIGDLVDKSILDTLPLKQEIIDVLKFGAEEKDRILRSFKKVMDDAYFQHELAVRKPSWFNDQWIRLHIERFKDSFDESLHRWRKLYRAAQGQISAATSIIENRIYADNHQKKKEAYTTLKNAERERDLLLNESSDPKKPGKGGNSQSEFYPYRYLAAEGFLPGYNFTRLPIRSFMQNWNDNGEYVSRARFVALNEFGPRNVIYHDGAKFRIDRMPLSDAALKLESGKICPKTGYFLHGKQYGYEVDPILQEPLQLDLQKHVHTTLLEMSETKAMEVQRITCQEEERSKKGYDIQTYFAVDGGMENTAQGIVRVHGDKLLHLHYLPTCRIFKLNLKWRSSQENGFTFNLNTGFWLSQKQREEKIAAGEGDNIREVKLFTSDTSNALYIQPIMALGIGGGSSGVITLMFALKRAIENYFQIESSELGATVMGQEDAPNILIYEAAEGSLGVLSQVMDNPAVYKAIMAEAYKVCFYKNEVEEEGDVLPATYDDLLSYYNQYYHQQIDRNLIRGALRLLRDSSIEIIANRAFASFDEQYRFLQAARDPNSSTEEKFLDFLYQKGLRLPDEAQPNVPDLYTRPDFFYAPNVYVFCDGSPHDRPEVAADDYNKRTALKNTGYQVLAWHYKTPLEDFIAKRPDIFKKVKDQ